MNEDRKKYGKRILYIITFVIIVLVSMGLGATIGTFISNNEHVIRCLCLFFGGVAVSQRERIKGWFLSKNSDSE